MPTLVQVRNAINSRLSDLWTNHIVPRQADYLAAHGRYWQGLVFNGVPNNASSGDPTVAETACDHTKKPTDQVHSWADAGVSAGATWPAQLRIDVYNGPTGHGFVGVARVQWNGNVYQRSHNTGPETWCTHDWTQVE